VNANEALLTVTDGHLCFDGFDVVKLARRLPTPFFLYSERQLRWNIESLRNAFTRRHIDTEIFFASKACSNRWFLDQVRASGINVEVNAGGELEKALRAGFLPAQIVFNGVAKTRAEIGQALATGVRCIIVDSLFELERVAFVGGGMRAKAPVALRVDVDVPTLTHPGLATTHGGKAGIDLDDALEGFRYAAAHEWLDPKGLHMHIGSQITSVGPYETAMLTALDLIDRIEEQCGITLDHLNAGGGFAIPYREAPVSCPPTDYFCSTLAADDYADAICTALDRRRPGLRLFLEPGRSIAGNTAVLVSRIENQKIKGVRNERGARVGGERWVTVDAGFNTLLEHTNYAWYFRTIVANRVDEPVTTGYRLAGPLCDGGDVFAGDGGSPLRMFPAATTVDDVVVFVDTGAYTLEMMNPYNARPRAAAYAVHDGGILQIRRVETVDDMVMHDTVARVDVGD
jgi:diaminopimelate decarboxylase